MRRMRCRKQSRNFMFGSGGYPIPPCRGWPPAGSESDGSSGDWRRGAKGSEPAGCVIQPRNSSDRGRRHVQDRGRPHRSAAMAWRRGPTGVKWTWHVGTGVHWEPGRPLHLLPENTRMADRDIKARPRRAFGCARPGSESNIRPDQVPHVEGRPKAWGMGGEESERLDSTAEAGKPTPREPVEGSGASGTRNRWRER